MNLPEIFSYTFFIKSLLISLWISLVFSILGIFVLIRRMSFFSDGLAHSIILSLALAFLFNQNFFYFALIGGFLFSCLIYFLEKKSKIYSDALIGLIFVFFLSLGLILMSQKAGYQPELLNFLVGNILSLNNFDFFFVLVVSFVILVFLILNFKKFSLVLTDKIEAKIRGINVDLYEFLFYILLGSTVVLGIKIAGVVLVTAFLILPPTIASLIATSYRGLLFFSIFFGLLNSFLGFLISGIYNFPISASISFVGSIFFFIFFVYQLLKK